MSRAGSGEPVPFLLVADLHLEVVPADRTRHLRVSGTLMESARVFNSVQLEVRDDQVFVTVTSSFLEYLPGGGPDFNVELAASLTAGRTYTVYYRSPGEPDQPVGVVEA